MTPPPVLDSVLARFAPIDLEALNAQASLLSRVDRKYALSVEDTRSLLAELHATSHAGTPAQVLQIGDTRSHAYASHYFDTPEYDSFFASAHRHRRRFKVRIRHYLDSDLAFVEVKTRGPWGRTVKERLPYSSDLARRTYLNLPALVWVHEQLEQASCNVDVSTLRPRLHGSFQRSTLLIPGDDHGAAARASARATIDTNLSWIAPATMSDPNEERYCNPSLVIIETKSPSAPSALDRLLWSRGIRPTRVSKYATALCVMRPTLPQNRWNRTIRRHFPPATPLLAPESEAIVPSSHPAHLNTASCSPRLVHQPAILAS